MASETIESNGEGPTDGLVEKPALAVGVGQDGADRSEQVDLTEKYPADQPVTTLDAKDMQSLFRAAYDWLAHNYEQVNRLNVFPVPDGDTGTNMLLTIKSAWNNILHRGGDTVGEVAAAAAEGAHQGSRGNSGVILGQILRGFSQALRGKKSITTNDLAEALNTAAEAAYDAVPSPVEGTILTVSRDISTAATDAAGNTRDVRRMLAHVVAEADKAVHRTPDLLPVLKKAGVVDSGGKGLFFFFEGMYRALNGQPVRTPGDEQALAVVDERAQHREHKGHRELPPIQWGFDVQYLIERPNKAVYAIAADIAAMGECPLVEGDDKLVKVHIHVFDPGVALSYGVATGFITDVVVENMDDMAAAMQIGSGVRGAEPPIVPITLDEEGIGVVAVVPGVGFADIFSNLGAHGLVRGGQSMNPSVAELVEAIRKLPSRRVILLPNNSNIMMASQQAARLLAKETPPHQVAVVPAKTMPQGVAALMAFDPSVDDLEELKGRMEAQVSAVQTGEVTQAVRTAEVDGISVHQGDLIGLHNGKLIACGGSIHGVALELLAKMGTGDSSLITIYYGDFVAEAAAENFAETVSGEYPDQDVELAYGGQPHYHFILSVE